MTKTFTAKQMATAANVSRRSIYRWIRAGKLTAAKVNGQWEIALTAGQHRALKRRFVDLEHAASTTIRSKTAAESIATESAQKAYARDALVALGAGDLVLAIDHAKLWRGRSDKYGKNVYRAAMADIERQVAA